MLKIKDVLPILGEIKSVHLSYNGLLTDFFTDNELMVAAYGDFLVKTIYAVNISENGTDYEIDIASMPLKGGA